MPRRTVKSRPLQVRAGFTLLEAVIATALVGMAVAALMVTTQMSTRVNGSGKEMTQASYLLEEVREFSLKRSWGRIWPAVDDGGLDGAKWSPPRQADGTVLTDMSDWTQAIHVDWKNPTAIQNDVAPNTSDLIRVTVTVSHRGTVILSSGWLVAKKDGET